MNNDMKGKPSLPPLPETTSRADKPLWYYADAERQIFGPIPFDDLKRLMLEGTITAETLVVTEGAADWKPYADSLKTYLPPIPVIEEEIDLGKKGRAAAGGKGCLGLGFGAFFIIIGISLCVTGIGAILGIPLILGALAFMHRGGQKIGESILPNRRVLRGNCPYCKHPNIETAATAISADCPACKKHFVIRNRTFMRVD